VFNVPASYRIERSLECIFVTLEGTVTDRDLIEGQRQMFSDPAFEGHYTRLVDAMQVTCLSVKGRVVRAVAKAATRQGVRKAALVANSDFVYAMMRMYEGYSSEADCWVCRDVNEALAFLLGGQREKIL
jgi:hypothetical protein